MRTFPLLDDVKELLLKLKAQQDENRVTRTFIKVLQKHGLKVIRFHDLRHSAASILYDKGWGLKDIQDWLGHGKHKNALPKFYGLWRLFQETNIFTKDNI